MPKRKKPLSYKERKTPVYIYGLVDPNTDAIMYIGQTSQDIKARLRDHISKARRHNGASDKNEWISTLLSEGKKPVIELLEKTTREIKSEREAYWLEKHKETALNIAPAGAGGAYDHRILWTKELDAKLGVLSDAEIAEEIGCTRKAVSYRRIQLGIKASNNKRRMKPPPNRGGWNKIILTDETIAELGKCPDHVLAKVAGVDKTVIARARRKRGIKSYAEQTGNNGQFKKGNPHPRWSRIE